MAECPFSETDMMILSQLSYYDIPDATYTMISLDNSTQLVFNPKSLYSILTDKAVKNNLYKDLMGDVIYEKYKNSQNMSIREKEKVNRITEQIQSLIDKSKRNNFMVSNAVNDKDVTGFAAIAITGPEDTVTVAVRGTEGFSLDDDSKKDVYSDLQLGYMNETNQQKKMNEFMNSLNDYDSIYLTGHSLGGNLAVSGAVCFVDPDKIKGVYTFNAPGQNDSYILNNWNGIQAVQNKITNFQNEGDGVSDINTPIGNVVMVESEIDDNLLNMFGDNHLLYTMKTSGTDLKRSLNDKKSAIHNTIHEFVHILEQSLVVIVPRLITHPFTTIFFLLDILIVLYAVNITEEILVDVINKLKVYFNTNFSYGGRYATSNPYICVDTYKLKNYAQRMNRVNNRISSIDGRLDSLYWSICDFEDLIESAQALWNLMQADILTTYSLRLKACVHYLEDTADEFERIERDIVTKAK